MDYYSIYKTDKNFLCDNNITFKGGYSFNKKITITLYNAEMIEHILTKKFNKSLKNLINIYLMLENDEEGDNNAVDILEPKIEVLRNLLLGTYARFLDAKTVEDCLNKLEKFERKVGKLTVKKSRHL